MIQFLFLPFAVSFSYITVLTLKITISEYTSNFQHSHNLPSMSSTASNPIDKRAFPGKDCLYAHLAGIPCLLAIVLELILGFRTCRLTGAAAFTGIGAYALVQANQQGAFKRIRPQGAPVVAGKITGLIGTGE